MIEQAKSFVLESPPPKGLTVDFKIGDAESALKQFPNESVSFVGAFQAAHWFDHKGGKLHDELERILKPGGTVAWCGYGEVFFIDRPELAKLIDEYAHGVLGESY
jgi:trans-aconitate 3-methyltransferase